RYPLWYSIPNNTSFDGMSIYHSLAVRVQKRYSNGLSFVVAYTLSKAIANPEATTPAQFAVDPIHWSRANVVGGRAGILQGPFGVYQDEDNRKADRAVAAGDVPQLLNIAASYELPFGRGKSLLRNVNRVVNAGIGGWRLSANFNAESGVPLAIT